MQSVEEIKRLMKDEMLKREMQSEAEKRGIGPRYKVKLSDEEFMRATGPIIGPAIPQELTLAEIAEEDPAKFREIWERSFSPEFRETFLKYLNVKETGDKALDMVNTLEAISQKVEAKPSEIEKPSIAGFLKHIVTLPFQEGEQTTQLVKAREKAGQILKDSEERIRWAAAREQRSKERQYGKIATTSTPEWNDYTWLEKWKILDEKARKAVHEEIPHEVGKVTTEKILGVGQSISKWVDHNTDILESAGIMKPGEVLASKVITRLATGMSSHVLSTIPRAMQVPYVWSQMSETWKDMIDNPIGSVASAEAGKKYLAQHYDAMARGVLPEQIAVDIAWEIMIWGGVYESISRWWDRKELGKFFKQYDISPKDIMRIGAKLRTPAGRAKLTAWEKDLLMRLKSKVVSKHEAYFMNQPQVQKFLKKHKLTAEQYSAYRRARWPTEVKAQKDLTAFDKEMLIGIEKGVGKVARRAAPLPEGMVEVPKIPKNIYRMLRESNEVMKSLPRMEKWYQELLAERYSSLKYAGYKRGYVWGDRWKGEPTGIYTDQYAGSIGGYELPSGEFIPPTEKTPADISREVARVSKSVVGNTRDLQLFNKLFGEELTAAVKRGGTVQGIINTFRQKFYTQAGDPIPMPGGEPEPPVPQSTMTGPAPEQPTGPALVSGTQGRLITEGEVTAPPKEEAPPVTEAEKVGKIETGRKRWLHGAEPMAAIPGEPMYFLDADRDLTNWSLAITMTDDMSQFVIMTPEGKIIPSRFEELEAAMDFAEGMILGKRIAPKEKVTQEFRLTPEQARVPKQIPVTKEDEQGLREWARSLPEDVRCRPVLSGSRKIRVPVGEKEEYEELTRFGLTTKDKTASSADEMAQDLGYEGEEEFRADILRHITEWKHIAAVKKYAGIYKLTDEERQIYADYDLAVREMGEVKGGVARKKAMQKLGEMRKKLDKIPEHKEKIIAKMGLTDEAEKQLLKRLVYQDALTGVLSRHAWDQDLPKATDNMDAVMVWLDIAGLKKLNNLHGDIAGDKFLATWARVYDRFNLGTNDVLYRVGGDEFRAITEDFRTSAEMEAIANKVIEIYRKLEPDIPIEDLPRFRSIQGQAGIDETADEWNRRIANKSYFKRGGPRHLQLERPETEGAITPFGEKRVPPAGAKPEDEIEKAIEQAEKPTAAPGKDIEEGVEYLPVFEEAAPPPAEVDRSIEGDRVAISKALDIYTKEHPQTIEGFLDAKVQDLTVAWENAVAPIEMRIKELEDYKQELQERVNKAPKRSKQKSALKKTLEKFKRRRENVRGEFEDRMLDLTIAERERMLQYIKDNYDTSNYLDEDLGDFLDDINLSIYEHPNRIEWGDNTVREVIDESAQGHGLTPIERGAPPVTTEKPEMELKQKEVELKKPPPKITQTTITGYAYTPREPPPEKVIKPGEEPLLEPRGPKEAVQLRIDEQAKLKDLGFSDTQIGLMNEDAKNKILKYEIPNKQVDILPNGDLAIVGGEIDKEGIQWFNGGVVDDEAISRFDDQGLESVIKPPYMVNREGKTPDQILMEYKGKFTFKIPAISKAKDFANHMHWLYTQAVDRVHGIARYMPNKLVREYDIQPIDNPKLLAYLFTGWHGKVQTALEAFTFKLVPPGNVVITGPGLAKLIAPYAKNHEELMLLTAAMREIWLAQNISYAQPGLVPRDIKGVDVEKAMDVVWALKQKFGVGYAALEKTAKDVMAWENRAILGPLHDVGRVSTQEYNAMRKQPHIPFARVIAEAKADLGFLKPFQGSERVIRHPYQEMIERLIITTIYTDKQRIRNAIVNLPQIASEFKEIIFEVDKNDLDYPFKIRSYDNGEDKYFAVPKDMAKSVDYLNPPTVGLVYQILGVPKRLLQLGATMNIAFMGRNIGRDSGSAFIYSENNFIPFFDHLPAIAHMLKKSDLYFRWLASGGAHSALLSMQDIRLGYKYNELLSKSGILKYAKNPLRMGEIIGETIENSTRFAEFRKAVNAGKPELIGAYESKEVSVNFGRWGIAMTMPRRLVAFYTANVAGNDRMARSFKDHPVRTIYKALIWGTIPALIEYALFHDDERWKNLPPWRKYLFINIPVGKYVIPFPVPFEMGMVFKGLVTAFLEYVNKEDPMALRNWIITFLSALAPGMWGLPMPTAFMPFIEDAAKWSYFFQRPLPSRSVQDLTPPEQYTPYTTETAKALGKVLYKSPTVIENYVNTWGGGLGRDILWTVDQAFIASGLLKPEAEVEKTLTDFPWTRGFLTRQPIGMGSYPVQRFYEELEKIEAEYNTQHRKVDRGTIKLEDFEKSDIAKLNGAMQKIREEIVKLRGEREKIMYSPIDPIRKREVLEILDGAMTQIAARAVTNIYIFKEKTK